MLVRVVKISEECQGWRKSRIVRAIVRLHQLDFCPHRFAQGFDSPARVVELRLRISDGERQDSILRRGIGARLVDGDRADEVIEGGPKVVEGVSRDERPTDKRLPLQDMNDSAVSGSIRVLLLGNSVRLTINPGARRFL